MKQLHQSAVWYSYMPDEQHFVIVVLFHCVQSFIVPVYVADDLRVSRSWLCLHKTFFLLFFELAATCCSLFHILRLWVARITSSKRRLIIQLCCLIHLYWRPIQYRYWLLCCHRGITILTPPPTTTSYAYVTFTKTVRHNRGTTALWQTDYMTGVTDTCPLCINVLFYSG